tara:strand:+ start:1061 stop:1888 length:828 start_codon:yes stop_codon:yes gene_type:complete
MKFSAANTKLKKLYKLDTTVLKKWLGQKIGRSTAKVYSFDLLSGVDCPFAMKCKSEAEVQEDGRRKIKDGPDTEFRCFSASQEVLFTTAYNARKRNHDAIHALETSDDIADALIAALPKDARIIRIHVAGDMFSHKYFMAWIKVAERTPNVLFYAYTKSLVYWVRSRDSVPFNLVLTASYGGRNDELIAEHGLRSAKVVYSEAQAERMGLEIDHDDSHACDPTRANQDFALLIHGVQPKGSLAADALKILKKGDLADSEQVSDLEDKLLAQEAHR